MKLKIIAMMVMASGVACQGQFYFEAGPWYRGNMEISAEGGSRAAAEGIHASRTGRSGGTPVAAGSLLQDDGTAQTLRTFDNGYVGPSGWDWAQTAGVSQYWSYTDPAQYDATAGALNYRRTLTATETAQRTLTQVTPGAAGWSDSDRAGGAGLQAKLGYVLHATDTWNLGVQLQAGWLDGINSSFHHKTAYTEQVEDFRWQTILNQQETWGYSYDTLGNPAFPDIPYTMSDPSGTGPMIADRPQSMTRLAQAQTSSDVLVGRTSETATSLVDMDVDATALVLQVGPRFQWQATRTLGLSLQPAISLNLLDADIHRHEAFRHDNGTLIQSWDDVASEQTWLLGAGLQADVQWTITGGVYVLVGGGYDWVEPCDLSSGPDQITIDLSGYTLNAGVGYRF
ncbi:MAG: hypothetical protein WCS52_18410 [bacterium]